MISEGLWEVFKCDSADTCAGKFPLVSMWGRADPSNMHRQGARTPIGASGNFIPKLCNKIIESIYNMVVKL